MFDVYKYIFEIFMLFEVVLYMFYTPIQKYKSCVG